MRGQGPFFSWNQDFLTSQVHISKTFHRSELKLSPAFPLSILNGTTCCFRISIHYLWCMIAYRKGAASPSPEKSPGGKFDQWPWLTSETVWGPMNRSMWKMSLSQAFGVITSTNPKTANLTTSVNTRPAGGDIFCPLPDFLDSSKKRELSTRNVQYLLQHQLYVCHQNFRKIRGQVLKKMVF